jgi:FAD-dependent urate hydroxylase
MLAKCLRDVRPPARALARYEELRRPRAERIVAMGRRRGAYKAPGSRAAVFLRDLVMPLAFRLFATEKAMAWIYDYAIPWEEAVA